MFGWLRRLFHSPALLDLDYVPGRMRPCRIRLYTPADFETCVELYRLNEPGRFPGGVLPHFEKTLREGKVLFLVIEEVENVIACGGVRIISNGVQEVALLSFGLVHPKWHRKGFGTALLLARLALLPTDIALASLSPVPASETFYWNFGFREYGRSIREGIDEGPVYGTSLSPDLIGQCRSLLDHTDILLPPGDVTVPVWYANPAAAATKEST